ncbi:hypothetical protein [Colwellia sp. 12G3]|uniref:hypothetical protein n=1 Tax=Colwellia sp. 12G3 TaxID=2058299 RepID=UPI000C328F69|nr:hypothetical protein [Colwellia sp. 12G3]PKI16194.1 hypothetical protein CXF71_11165 [Colwellia sp. 12G3]
MQTKNNKTKVLFLIAAVFNVSIGATFLFAHQWLFSFIGFELTDKPQYNVMVEFTGLAITTFGVGYYLASKDLNKYQAIVWLGMMAKIGVFVLFSYHLFLNITILPLFLAGSCDLVFAGLFWFALKNNHKINLNR